MASSFHVCNRNGEACEAPTLPQVTTPEPNELDARAARDSVHVAAPLAPPDPERVRRVLAFALDVGSELFIEGAETASISTTVAAIAGKESIGGLQMDITDRTILVQWTRPGQDPLVMMATVRANDARDIGRVGALTKLVREFAEGRLDLDGAEARLSEIIDAGPSWPWYISSLGGAALAISICLQANGTVLAALVAGLVFVVAERVGWLLSLASISEFFQIATRAIVAVVASVASLTLLGMSGAEAASISAANLVLLLPILSLVSLVEDAVGGYNVMAAVRLIRVVLMTAAIVTGLAVVASIARNLDLIGAAGHVEFAPLPFVTTVLASIVGAVANAVLMGSRTGWFFVAGLAGAITGAVYWFALHVIDLDVPLAILLATAVLGVLSTRWVRRWSMPAQAIVIPGVTGAVLPGPAVYSAISQVYAGITGSAGFAVQAVLSTAVIGIGVVLGEQLASARRRRRPPRPTLPARRLA